jgi:hypothetical protein
MLEEGGGDKRTGKRGRYTDTTCNHAQSNDLVCWLDAYRPCRQTLVLKPSVQGLHICLLGAAGCREHEILWAPACCTCSKLSQHH